MRLGTQQTSHLVEKNMDIKIDHGIEVRAFEAEFINPTHAFEWAQSLIHYFAETEYTMIGYSIDSWGEKFCATVKFERQH